MNRIMHAILVLLLGLAVSGTSSATLISTKTCTSPVGGPFELVSCATEPLEGIVNGDEYRFVGRVHIDGLGPVSANVRLQWLEFGVHGWQDVPSDRAATCGITLLSCDATVSETLQDPGTRLFRALCLGQGFGVNNTVTCEISIFSMFD